MSHYPGQQQYSQGPPGQQQQPPQYPPQGHAPQYTHGGAPPPHGQQQQYGQPPQGYPQQAHPPQGHSPGHQSPAPPSLPGAHTSQGYGPPGQGGPRPSAAVPSSNTDSGTFPGGSYAITHRDTNTALTIDLQAPNVVVKSAPGAMVHMAGTVQLAGKTKFSFSKMLTGGEMHESSCTGRGKIVLAPTLFGDIFTLQIDPRTQWRIGKDAYLASTGEVSKENKMQGLGKALFSGEDLFVYNVFGNGLMWLKSFGAVDRITLQPGEQHVVDNGHLVPWNMDYKIEKAGGGFMTARKTGEGLVCRFQGPGTVYIQTRNMEAFEEYIRSVVPSTGG